MEPVAVVLVNFDFVHEIPGGGERAGDGEEPHFVLHARGENRAREKILRAQRVQVSSRASDRAARFDFGVVVDIDACRDVVARAGLHTACRDGGAGGAADQPALVDGHVAGAPPVGAVEGQRAGAALLQIEHADDGAVECSVAGAVEGENGAGLRLVDATKEVAVRPDQVFARERDDIAVAAREDQARVRLRRAGGFRPRHLRRIRERAGAVGVDDHVVPGEDQLAGRPGDELVVVAGGDQGARPNRQVVGSKIKRLRRRGFEAEAPDAGVVRQCDVGGGLVELRRVVARRGQRQIVAGGAGEDRVVRSDFHVVGRIERPGLPDAVGVRGARDAGAAAVGVAEKQGRSRNPLNGFDDQIRRRAIGAQRLELAGLEVEQREALRDGCRGVPLQFE